MSSWFQFFLSVSLLSLFLATTSNALVQEDSRMIAYLGNWQACPSVEQLSQYTYVAIGFAVTYWYAEKKNECNQFCEIFTPVICANTPQPDYVRNVRASGTKFLLSFGGAGMGGSWDGDINDCWDHCFGSEDYVVDRLVSLVAELGMDGVDIDYEYFYEDNQNGKGFTRGAEAIKFLRDVTIGLRQKLPVGKIVAHAPMDADIVPGTAYFEMLKDVAWALDFIMPQYYNGLTRAQTDGFHNAQQGQMATADHYDALVNQVFGGDATRIVFGFCIADCSGTTSNSNGIEAASVMQEVNDAYSCNGGAFFWVAADDAAASWSTTVNQAMNFNRGCSGGLVANNPALPAPTPTTYKPPTPYTPPAAAPAAAPASGNTPPTAPVYTGPNFYDPNNMSGVRLPQYGVGLLLGSAVAWVLM
jgi:chitinase